MRRTARNEPTETRGGRPQLARAPTPQAPPRASERPLARSPIRVLSCRLLIVWPPRLPLFRRLAVILIVVGVLVTAVGRAWAGAEWRSTGRILSYAFIARDGQVWKQNADGSGRARLSAGRAGVYSAAWSPRGDRLVLERHSGNNKYVEVLDSDGSHWLRLGQGGRPNMVAGRRTCRVHQEGREGLRRTYRRSLRSQEGRNRFAAVDEADRSPGRPGPENVGADREGFVAGARLGTRACHPLSTAGARRQRQPSRSQSHHGEDREGHARHPPEFCSSVVARREKDRVPA